MKKMFKVALRILRKTACIIPNPMAWVALTIGIYTDPIETFKILGSIE